MRNIDEYTVLGVNILLYGVQFCGVKHMEGTCGELYIHQFYYRIIIIYIHIKTYVNALLGVDISACSEQGEKVADETAYQIGERR